MSLRLVLYVFLPAFLFTTALDAIPLAYFPFPPIISRLLKRLLVAGLPFEEVSSPGAARDLVVLWAARLTSVQRALDVADVVLVPLPGIWTHLTAALVKSGSASSGDVFHWFVHLLPDWFHGGPSPLLS